MTVTHMFIALGSGVFLFLSGMIIAAAMVYLEQNRFNPLSGEDDNNEQRPHR